MREIGRIDHAAAVIFGDYLVVQGIENQIDSTSDGLTAIWVMREEQLESARAMFARFRESPGDASWRDAATRARELRERTAAEEARRDANIRTPAADWQHSKHPWLTTMLILSSIVVTLVCEFGKDRIEFARFSVNSFSVDGQPAELFQDILHGQLWRLVTPIFLHLSPMHIFFNMMWLFSLGRMIELRQGWRTFALMVLVIASVSDCAQYLYSGPLFGGMSGVVYGLFGYVWIRSSLERGGGYFISRINVILMIVWFFLCTTGAIGPVGNVAHGVGLVLGALWGVLSVRKVRQRILGIFGR